MLVNSFRISPPFFFLILENLDDLNDKKTIEFRKDSNENAPLKTWNHLARHITNDLIENLLHESVNTNNNGHHAVKKARRTNDGAQKIRQSTVKATGILPTKNKRTTRRSRM